MLPMKRLAVQALAITSFVLGSVGAVGAAPITKEACISSNEGAQVSRQKGELRAARDQLLVCVSEGCPKPIREDCKERLAEIERAAPTIVFTAKDPAGNVLTAVTVVVDDKPFADRLDGTALLIDPGEHVFKLTASGYPPVTRKVVLREAEKNHAEEISFALGGKPAAPVAVVAPPPEVAPSPIEPPPPESDPGSTQRTVAYVLGGAGIVGIGIGTIFGFVSKSTYDEATRTCPTGPASCDDAGVSGGESAHGQAAISTAAFIVGGVLLGAGLTTLLTAPKKSGVSVQPTASAGAAGIRIGGRW